MNKEQAKALIKDTFEASFDKEKFTKFIKDLLNRIDESKAFHARGDVKEMFRNVIKTYERIGTYNSPEGKKIDIIITYLQKGYSLDHARVTQRNFAGRYLTDRGGKDAGLFAFVSPEESDWRFSLVKMDYKFEKTKTGEMKVKEEFTPARRWSFLVGANEKSHTAKSQLVDILKDDEHDPTLEEIEKAFDIETVTKEFFLKYRNLLIRTVDALDSITKRENKVRTDFELKNINTVDFAKKLLGQIVFLYFLQKKGWFGVKRDQDWGSGSKHFLRKLFDKKHGNYKNFFNNILESLFYEALARERDDNFYSRFNCKIPFLNGGLFEPIGGYDWVHTDITLPNELFSNKRKTPEGDTGDGILDIFDRFNFTVKEDEPLEKEVAIDPELLGKLYEKFNAIRPDNFYEYKEALVSCKRNLEKKFNKKFGVYYTPREIVHYMCQQSLINYLATELSHLPAVGEKPDAGDVIASEAKQSQIPVKEDIQMLIKYGEQFAENEAVVIEKGKETKTYQYKIPESVRKNAKIIDEKLKDIKVCDPAVGSGAFPVGMMAEIVKTRKVLTVYLQNDSHLSHSAPVSGFSFESHSEFISESRNPYKFKRDCIENSLYGVDIDPGAVEMTKLRLWLSLIVDEEDIRQIKPLPNLDYKIVCGNSLLGVEKNLFNLNLFNDLEKLKPLFFNETNPRKKQEYKKQIEELISEITNGHKEFDFEVYFSEVFHDLPATTQDATQVGKGGFDVVIANPPYVRQEEIKDQKESLKRQGYDVYNSTSDLYTYFYERSWKILKPEGFSCFISSNKWMRAKYGEKLRRFFKIKTTLKQIIDFNGYQVFDATVDTDILLFQKTKPSGNIVIILNIQPDFTPSTDITNYFNSHKLEMKQSDFDSNCFTLGDETTLNLKKRIEQRGIPLKNWDVKIYRGIITGFNEAFIIDTEIKEKLCKEDPKSAEIIKPILRGRDIYRYGYKWAGLWLLKIESRWTNQNRSKKAPEVFFKESYPAVYRHLKTFGNTKGKGKGLYNRDDQGDYWWELRDCNYYPEFEKEKIMYSDIADRLLFVYEGQKIYTNNTVYFLNTGNKYLLAALNSMVIDFYYRQISSQLGNAALRAFTIYVEQLPIPKISESEQKPFIEIVDRILSLAQSEDYLENPQKQAKVKEYERQIDQLIYKLYGLTKEEIKIIEEHSK